MPFAVAAIRLDGSAATQCGLQKALILKLNLLIEQEQRELHARNETSPLARNFFLLMTRKYHILENTIRIGQISVDVNLT